MSHTYHPPWRGARRRSEWRFGFKLLCPFSYVCIVFFPLVSTLGASVNINNRETIVFFVNMALLEFHG